MRRAVILIVVMCLVGLSAGVWMEQSLRESCGWYRAQGEMLRNLVTAEALSEALQKEAYVQAHWQGEVRKLNALVSHHHTRAVDDALLKLTTSLEMGWQKEALLSLDALRDALDDLEMDMTLRWENVL
ncbi:MAG: DUF4363 family protein [Clostridiales bacterium]|nr:DUF4363 family protein [Clostridiales bacterium]